MADAEESEHEFSHYVRTLGRGPGRSRALTRDEARAALTAVLEGRADPHQVGAFLMLLRYRGEDPAEMAGLVEAARAAFGAGRPENCPAVALDWPSYGAGRTRGAPWFLLSALALAAAGHTVLMHGSNEFGQGTAVADALPAFGLPVCTGREQAAGELRTRRFAYLTLAALCPPLDALLRLRGLLGLRSPINTAIRLLDPFDAAASVDGVFHPPYLALHVQTAALLGRPRLVVVKGGGGEAERNPGKPVSAHWFDAAEGQGETLLPALATSAGSGTLQQAWSEGTGAGAATARATVALALLAMGVARTAAAADAAAEAVWAARLSLPLSSRTG